MAITYPVDVENTLWATYYEPTGEITARRKKWPVADGGPIVGQDESYIMLQHVDDVQPAYDSRLYILESTEAIDVDGNVLHLSHATVARPNDERIIAAENEEANQLGKHVNLVREAIKTRLMVGAIIAYIVDAQQFPPKVQTMSEAYKNLAIKLWRNRDRLDEIVAAIEAGEDPDLDAGWELP